METVETVETVESPEKATKETPAIKEMELNGCHVKLIFAEEPVDGVIERVKEILGYDHNESSKELNKPA